jgi:hypothetical protein
MKLCQNKHVSSDILSLTQLSTKVECDVGHAYSLLLRLAGLPTPCRYNMYLHVCTTPKLKFCTYEPRCHTLFGYRSFLNRCFPAVSYVANEFESRPLKTVSTVAAGPEYNTNVAFWLLKKKNYR